MVYVMAGLRIVLCLLTFALLDTGECFITWINPKDPLIGEESPPGAVWPKPVTWQQNPNLRTIDPDTFLMTTNTQSCDVIDSAISRYGSLIKLDDAAIPDPGLAQISQLSISILDTNCAVDFYPFYGMDESYALGVSAEASLTANSIWGALRGLETFSQLIYLTDDKRYQLNETFIDDAPRFAYRGLMIDTARHFEPIGVILQILDAMSWDKFNILHWHVVDDQSFPYPSRTFPELQEQGSYTPYHRYTRANIATVLREARLRGIAVIPEFDTPGHTWSWGQSHPELITPCWGQGLEGGPGVPDYPNHGPREVMNPSLESTFTFLDALYQEIVEDFPGSFVHLGMDEAYYACWESSPNISQFMTEMGFTETFQLEQYFSNRLIEIVEAKGTNYIIWEDPINNGVTVDAATLVEVWKDWMWQDSMTDVTSQGYDVILSAPWYLNYISYGEDWRKYYEVEPHSFTNNSQYWSQVKGGEVCMWSEFVDSTNILSRLWPRASAAAERLWSPKNERNTEDAKFRLDQHRCRYVRRGFPAQPILNGYCGDYEWLGDSVADRLYRSGADRPRYENVMTVVLLSTLLSFARLVDV